MERTGIIKHNKLLVGFDNKQFRHFRAGILILGPVSNHNYYYTNYILPTPILIPSGEFIACGNTNTVSITGESVWVIYKGIYQQ